MRFCLVSIFPSLIQEFVKFGLIKRAIEDRLLEVEAVNLRDFTHDRHQVVDDAPFGGGGGMVLRPEPLFEAVEAKKRDGEKVVLMSPQGSLLSHAKAVELARLPGLVVICGRYEGVDERVRKVLVDEEISIGDYVLMGGELPALVMMETVVRHVPGVVGNQTSVEQDSFATGLLDFPHFTRPAEHRGLRVPDVLVSGNHEEVARWRRREAIRQTLAKRPDLLEKIDLSEEEKGFVEALKNSARRATS